MQANELNPLFIVIPILFVGIAMFYFSWKVEQERRKLLEQWGAARKLRYSEHADTNISNHYAHIDLFQNGFDRYGQFFAEGLYQDFQIRTFDYHYKTRSGSGKNKRTQVHWYAVAVIQSPVHLEPLFIRPEGFFDKVTEFVGFDDIDFESAEFSKRFYVKAQNRKWAFDVLHSRAMEFMLAQDSNPTITFHGGSVFVWLKGKHKPSEREKILRMGCGLIKLLPDYVKTERAIS